MKETVEVTDEIVNKIAEEARADVRTVYRRLSGLPVRGRAGRDIDAAIERARILPARRVA